MTPVNEAYLSEQFRLIVEYLSRARRIAQRSNDEFLSDPTAIDAAVRQVTVLFETSHNIAKHIIAQQDWRSPQSKAEAFEILAENRVLQNDLVGSFREASRFRDLVTYQTAVVNDKVVLQILREHLGDFERFMSQVAVWLKGDPR